LVVIFRERPCWGNTGAHKLARLSYEAQRPASDEGDRQQRWKQALAAADKLRDKFGESSVGLAGGMKGGFREKTHENPVGMPGKGPKKD